MGEIAGSYQGNAFPPHLSGRIVSGIITVTAQELLFVGGGDTARMPTDGLMARRGGHNDEQIFFEHPALPGWVIYSIDPNLLKDPVLQQIPQVSILAREVAKSRTAIPLPLKLGLCVVALVLVALAVLVLQRDRIVRLIVDRIPLSWEQSLGDKVFSQIQAEGKLLEDSPWASKVDSITSRLVPVAEKSGHNFQFHIMQDTNINAFAMPGGHVVLLTGLLENARSGEEVAGVLAHEMAHVTERHSLRKMLESAGLIVLIQALFGDTSGVLAMMAEGSRFLLQQKFSRDFEREADDRGWAYLLEARIDPRGMISFFETLKKQAESSSFATAEQSLALLSTHPTSNERIERLKAKWEAVPNKTQFKEIGGWRD